MQVDGAGDFGVGDGFELGEGHGVEDRVGDDHGGLDDAFDWLSDLGNCGYDGGFGGDVAFDCLR